MPAHWPIWEVAVAVAVLVLMTGWAVSRGRAQPYLVVGWLWFLVMLVPVIGLVQVGSQAMANRYDYLPGVGLFILVIWGLRGKAPAFCGWLAVAGCAMTTWVQVHYWRDSETLFRHALAVTQNNAMMEKDLCKELLMHGRVGEALPHLQRAVQFAPRYSLSHYNLGQALLSRGDVADALAQFEIQTVLQPNDPVAQANFGAVLLEHGLAADAVPRLEKAVQLQPGAAELRRGLGDALRRSGQPAEAIRQYEECLNRAPSDVQAASSLAWMLATNPNAALRNGARALQLALLAEKISGGQDARIAGILAAAYAESGDMPKAAQTAQRALQQAAAQGQTALAGVLRQQLEFYRAGKPFRDKQ